MSHYCIANICNKKISTKLLSHEIKTSKKDHEELPVISWYGMDIRFRQN